MSLQKLLRLPAKTLTFQVIHCQRQLILARCTVKGVNLSPNNLSVRLWHCDFRQELLQDRLTDLEDLIWGEDGQAISQNFQTLVVGVLGEIESCLYRGEGGAMTFEAQISLSKWCLTVPPKIRYSINFHARYNKSIQVTSSIQLISLLG